MGQIERLMSDKTQPTYPRAVPWTLGSSADPNENIMISLAWILIPAAVCGLIGYLLWS